MMALLATPHDVLHVHEYCSGAKIRSTIYLPVFCSGTRHNVTSCVILVAISCIAVPLGLNLLRDSSTALSSFSKLQKSVVLICYVGLERFTPSNKSREGMWFRDENVSL